MSKVILVPAMFMIDNNRITDGRGMAAQLVPTPQNPNTFMPSCYQQTFYYNPLTDYMEWYGMIAGNWEYASIDTSSLRSSFTDLNALRDFIDERAKDTILVQRVGSSTWQFYFREASDRQIITDFWAKHTPIYIRLLSWPEHIGHDEWNKLVKEAQDWCSDTLTGKYILASAFHELSGSFQSMDDAALFKLKWTTA